jgi:outer membrane biosynthesis protein TonB
MIAGAVWSSVLMPDVARAQGPDSTLRFRTSFTEQIPGVAWDSMPDSHRSAGGPVDQPAAVLYCPPPQYPTELAAFGFDGEVDVQFVIDTTGRAELEDLLVTKASHPGFIRPVRRAMAKCRYRPAHKDGRPVRFLVRQLVRYHLGEEP